MSSNKFSRNPESNVFFILANVDNRDIDSFKDNHINEKNEKGETPLLVAARNAKPRLVAALIEAGGNIYL